MIAQRTTRRGVTMVELTVTIAVIALVAGVTSLAMRVPARAAPDDALSRIATLRRTSLAHGVAITDTLSVDGEVRAVTAFPDGRVITGANVRADLLTGRSVRDAAR